MQLHLREGSELKTYYCVTSACYDDGRVIASITDTVQADEMPESQQTSTRDRDIYCDWFASIEEARAFVSEAKLA